MKEYIEREAALKAVRDCTIIRDDILEAVSDIPTADVRENVRGDWIPFDECTYLCSNCSWVDAYRVSASVKVGFSFCPKCGADMRGESND